MSAWSHEPRFSGDSVRIPKICIAIALSLLIHATAMWQWKRELRTPSDDQAERGRAKGELTVQLAPRPSPPAPRSVPNAPPLKMFEKPRPPTPPPRQAAPKPEPPPQPAPPVIARSAPDAFQAPQPRPPASAPRPTPPPPEDFAAALEARRRARGESPAPAAQENLASPPTTEDANARANRIAAANLGTHNKPTFGADPRRGGGVFEIRHKGYDYAEFLFYGWNKDIRRNTAQVIPVRKAGHSTIELAIVRRMIVIIREHEQGDFVFESRRLGRHVTLSARARDNAGLEAFMLREFFEIDQR